MNRSLLLALLLTAAVLPSASEAAAADCIVFPHLVTHSLRGPRKPGLWWWLVTR